MPRTYRTIPSLTEQDIKRFWSKVDVRGLDECWPWKAGRYSIKGVPSYGGFKIRGQNYIATRVVYLLTHGTDLEEYFGCHSCDNPPCCNPAHIFKGTPLDNMKDKVAKGRHVTGLKIHPERAARGEAVHGSKLTVDLVVRILQLSKTGISLTKIGQQLLPIKISNQSIWRVVHRQTWLHVVPPAS